MTESIDVLKRLQSLKSKIDELESFKDRRKQDVRKKKQHIEELKAFSQKKQEEKRSVQKEIDRKELELRSNEGEITKYNVQLNSIKTNKEYSALCSEIGIKKADMALLEDAILNTMSKLETVSQEYVELTDELREEEESLKGLTLSVDADVKEIDLEVEKVKVDQKKYMDLLDEHSLVQYNRLSNIKGGKAVVPVVGNVCGGCFMNVLPQKINSLMSGKELVVCQSCSRILYLDKTDE